jgi:SWI/SNF-related matrix-associated actin-dependent regulator 1 of chromatin subfamily A
MKRHGRIILNDELGMGKRLSAIAAAISFKSEWPLLICCPAIFVHSWKEEFVKWIPNFDLTKITLVHGDPNAEIPVQPAITVISY